MQKGSGIKAVEGSLSKPLLLGLITATVTVIVAPLMLPHMTHPSMIFHIALHIAGLTLSLFLIIVSVMAYERSRSSRLLLMALAFSALGLVEFLYLLDALGVFVLFNFSALGIELTHMILLAMIALFGMGVLKVNR